MAAHLFRQYEALEEKEVGKAMDRGRRRALAKFGFLRGLLVVFPLLLLAQTAAAQGTWSPTGSMSTGRADFTLTQLCDGKVLVAGGSDASGTLSSAELYDPASGTWTPRSSMTTARASHSATLLPDCRVLVAGGAGPGGILSSAELYDPVLGTWSSTGSMAQARLYHTAVLLQNGKVLVAAGGIQGVGDTFGTASAELYDPTLETWSNTGPLTKARMNQVGVLLSDGKVLIAGGMDKGVTFQNFADAEIYDPDSGTWSPTTGSMAIGRRCCFTLTLLPSGKVLVAGGVTNWTAITTDKAELYDPTTGFWIPTTSLPTTRNGHSATLLLDGTVLTAGGNDHPQNFGPGTILNTALIYDPDSGTWSPTVGTMGEPRTGHRDVRLLDGRVMVAGGRTASAVLSTAELFGPADTTPPVVNVSFPSPNENGWFVTSPVVGSVTADDTTTNGSNITHINCTGATVGSITGLGTPSASAPLTVSAEGVNNISCTATDSAGNSGAATGSSNTATVMIDTVAPGITIVSPADGGSYLLNAAVASSYSCSDETSGVATCSGPVASGANFSTSPVGAHAFTVNATDAAGNPNQATNNYNVIYNFSGFFSPVDNPGPGPTFVFNVAKAGSAIPVKFSLSGAQGLNIFATDYPVSQQVICDLSAMDGIEQTVTAGSSSLSYDATTDQYIYAWKTNKDWAGTCRKLIVRLTDSTDHVAYFNFTK